MSTPLTGLTVLLQSERSVTVTEYAVMIALIVLVAITAISGIGVAVRDTFITLDNDVGAVS